MPIRPAKAAIFDMDGTIIASEAYTKQAVKEFLCKHGIVNTEIDYTQFFGVTWYQVAEILVSAYPALKHFGVAAVLQAYFHHLNTEKPAPYIPGARETFEKATKLVPTAIASSSHEQSVVSFINRIDIAHWEGHYVCAELCQRSKPDPDCYLLAAEKLKVKPAECLVFEDSIPGIQAAKSAGMQVVSITSQAPDRKLAEQIADESLVDYSNLAIEMWLHTNI